jgi:hypothetical protein
MTSEQIKNIPTIGLENTNALTGKPLIAIETGLAIQSNLWLKEIAYQIALWNEIVLSILDEERERERTLRREFEARYTKAEAEDRA